VRLVRSGDLRYVGQGYELRVGFPDGTLDETALAAVWAGFHRLHKADYGHFFPDSPIEIVNIRLTGSGHVPKMGRPAIVGGDSLATARVRQGTCVFRTDGNLRPFDTVYYQRDALPVDKTMDGPAVLLQRDATTVVPPSWNATLEPSGNIILRHKG
jgi:N-methylhydantoinase A